MYVKLPSKSFNPESGETHMKRYGMISSQWTKADLYQEEHFLSQATKSVLRLGPPSFLTYEVT